MEEARSTGEEDDEFLVATEEEMLPAVERTRHILRLLVARFQCRRQESIRRGSRPCTLSLLSNLCYFRKFALLQRSQDEIGERNGKPRAAGRADKHGRSEGVVNTNGSEYCSSRDSTRWFCCAKSIMCITLQHLLHPALLESNEKEEIVVCHAARSDDRLSFCRP